ncbi:hypothetical protein D0Z07_1358 [Hyphodiscus hymeniophilus]|uniref:Uncharacterized protein n=1 Tax=Hyphodiscus hymeniophilus TaxID=353542 RepID=A0A9P6VQH9_9HELO|nr:hypothetical protein D0Z07_1358 [Hyphodiscus hymeniophilus]
MAQKINTSRYYFEWAGHTIPDITAFNSIIKSERPHQPIIYLAGDSSFDNKHWVPSSGPGGEPLPVEVPSIYHSALQRPQPKADIAFWLNHSLGDRATALNCAVEATTLGQRRTNLLEHDIFIRDNIRAEDILLVSVGGNDIALKPTFATICRMLQLAWLTSRSSLQQGTAWSLGHFKDMFKNQVEAYISRLVEKQKPKAIVVCMIYYPLEAGVSKQSSWADVQLKLLGYDRFPGQLQTAIAKMYDLATKQVRIPGIKVVPCALFEAMDGKNEEDYTDRVEPSVEGGRKMALHLMEIIEPLISEQRT